MYSIPRDTEILKTIQSRIRRVNSQARLTTSGRKGGHRMVTAAVGKHHGAGCGILHNPTVFVEQCYRSFLPPTHTFLGASGNHLVAVQNCMSYMLTATETGRHSSTRHAPWVRQSGRGTARLAPVS